MEINTAPTQGLRALDQVFLTKFAVKELAEAHGMHATYMSCPSNSPEQLPSGFYLHQTLLDAAGNNLFLVLTGCQSWLGITAAASWLMPTG
jgi:glutamine synthetase